MKVRGLIFDINGTLIDINTQEEHGDIYRVLSNLLSYEGLSLTPEAVRDAYYKIMNRQRKSSNETYPEFDVVAIFREILKSYATDFTRDLPAKKSSQLPLFLAEVYRSVSRFRLQLYPGVKEVLDQLHERYLMAAVSDGQSAYAIPEMHAAGLPDYFKPVIVSGDLGYRKPDRRIFEAALSGMRLSPLEVLFIGNDTYRDIFGAQQLSLKAILFKSNQGKQETPGVEPDYVIRSISELPVAIRFFEEA
jgi:putative hydrolase of the HAD superfamily